MENNFELLRQSGFPKIGFQLMVMADAKRLVGENDQALTLLHRAVANSDEVGERLWLSEISRIRGNVQFGLNDRESATASYDTALGLARRQGSLLFELRAARDQAQLLLQQGRHQQAHALLAPVYDKFTEGGNLLDLTEAEVLLSSLT